MQESSHSLPNMSTIENELTAETLKRYLQKSIIIHKNKGFSLHNPQPIRQDQKNNIIVRTITTTFTRGAKRRMTKFMMTNKLKDKFYSFALTLTVPGMPLNETTIKKLWNLFHVYCDDLPFEFGAVWRAEVQERGQIHYHLICGATTTDTKYIIDEMEKLWIKTLKGVGQIPIEYTGTFKEPIKIEPEPGKEKETFDYWQSIEDAYQFKVIPNMRKFIYSKACQVDIFPTQEYGNWLRYITNHALKVKQKQVHSFNMKHWGKINKKAFEPDAGERTILDDNLFFQICRWMARLQTPIFKQKQPGHLFNRRKGRKNKHIGKSGLYNFFANPETMQRMLDLVLDKPPDKHSYLPT